jgi:hypothetical protein
MDSFHEDLYQQFQQWVRSENIPEKYAADLGLALLLKSAWYDGRKSGLRRAAEIANEPYSNAVQASGSDEPSEVGLKIAEAIEREAYNLEREGGVKKFSLKPDPHMRWIYDQSFQDDPKAKDLRARRDAAIRSAPQWMLDEAHLNDEREASKLEREGVNA